MNELDGCHDYSDNGKFMKTDVICDCSTHWSGLNGTMSEILKKKVAVNLISQSSSPEWSLRYHMVIWRLFIDK